MKKTYAYSVIASLVLATTAVASDWDDIDHGLEGSLRNSISEKHVHVDVHKGVVTLEGKVRTEADRQRIETLARNTAGVVAVKDKLEVTMPSPGSYGVVPAPVPSGTVQVYTTPPPEYTPPVAVVTTPAPVFAPDYPKLKVQASAPEDEELANRIAHHLRFEMSPATGFERVTITVRHGNVILQGVVDSSEERGAIIAGVQRAGGMAAIYDRLQVR